MKPTKPQINFLLGQWFEGDKVTRYSNLNLKVFLVESLNFTKK